MTQTTEHNPGGPHEPDVDTAAVRALAQSIEAAHDAVRACTMAVTRAVMMAHAQLLGSAVVSPVTAARVSASLGQLAWPAGTLGWAALHLSLDCRRVAAAYDAAEGRAAHGRPTRADFGG